MGHGVTTSFCGHKQGGAESLESVLAQGRADAQTQALRAAEQLIAEAQAEATQLLAQAEASAMARAEEAEVLATAALSEASAAQQRAAAAAAAAQEVGPAPPGLRLGRRRCVHALLRVSQVVMADLRPGGCAARNGRCQE